MSYKPTLSSLLSSFCQLSYTPKANIDYELTEYSITHLENKETDTQGFIASDDKYLYITFRGTTNSDDWMTNLSTQFTDLPHYKGLIAHAGFSAAYASVSKQVTEVIMQNLDKEVYITGHSLGGALANISLVELFSIEGIQLGGLYTYGSPRVFEESSAVHLNSSLKSKHLRVVNNNDIVPHVPPEFTNYSHWGTLIYLDEDGDIYTDKELTWWKTIQLTAEGIISDIGEIGVDAIKDHNINAYCDLIQSNNEKEI